MRRFTTFSPKFCVLVVAGFVLIGYAMVSFAAEYTPAQKKKVTTLPQDPVVVEIQVVYRVDGNVEADSVEVYGTAYITNKRELPKEVILRAISTSGDTLYTQSFND